MTIDLGANIETGLNYASHSFSGYLLAVGVIGGLTMALLQAAKDLTGWRARFNRDRLREWLQARVRVLNPDATDQAHFVDQAELELLRLATDRDADAFYGAELEALAAQFSGAALLVLDYPRLNSELFRLLTVHATTQDVDTLLQEYKPVIPIPGIAVQQYSAEKLTAEAETRHKLTETRNRIRHQVTQSISSFQVSAAARWQRRLKGYAWLTSTALTFIAFLFSDVGWRQAGWLLLLSAVSGFLAPIARDLLAALQRLRA